MSEFYIPLTKEQDREARSQLIALIKERHARNWEALNDDEWPLLDMPSGREALAFYRAQPAEWWANIAASYPGHARWHAQQYAALIRRYGPTNTLQVAS